MDVQLCLQCVSIFVATCAIFTYWFLSRKYSYWKVRGVPYEKPLPLLGNLGFVMRKSVNDNFKALGERRKEEYVGYFLGLQPALVIQTPELAKKIFIKDQDHFQDRFVYHGHVDPLGSFNLFTVRNPTWAIMRHLMTSMFTSSRLKMMTDLMNINAKELVNKIERERCTNDLFDLPEIFTMYTSDTVAFTAFGIRVSALSGNDSPLWLITNHMIKWKFWRGLEFAIILFLPTLAKWLRLQLFSATASEYIKKIFYNVVEERRKTNTINEKDLVNHLLKLKENCKIPTGNNPQLADDLMLAQVAVFILGSIETSTTALSCLMHELAHHPDVQEKLYNEINAAITRKGKDVLDFDDLLELKLLNACVYETMRKYPALGYLQRICTETYKLNEQVTIEQETPVLVNVMAIHYNEKFYPDPEKWDPHRTLPAHDNDNLQCNFLGFGEGPHFCIGKRLGMMQIRAAVVQILNKYKVERGPLPYNIPTDPYSVITTPKEATVRFVPR